MVEVPINYLAVLGCGVAAMVLGFLWYGPLFGKYWMKLSDMPADAMERAKNDPAVRRKMNMGYGLQFVGALVMAFVLAHAVIFAARYMQTWGVGIGLMTGFMSWLGFVAPVTLTSVLWEGRSWKLWFFNNAFQLVLLLIMSAILSAWV